MKRKMFIEVIDFKKEIKEYKLLCRCKSKKFKCYLEWKNHIVSLLNKINEKHDWENFKHYCRNIERSTRSIPTTYFNIMMLFVTFCVDKYITNVNILIWLLLFAYMMGNIIWQNNSYEKENYFYKDLLEIIEQEEQKFFQ